MKEKWEIKKLGDCFDVIRNGASIKQYDNADGYPITRIETLSNDLFNRDRLGYANIYEIEKYKNFLLKDNDILISHINSTKYLGRAVLYKKQENEKIIHGMNLLNLSGINSKISPDYISYYFKTESYKIQIFKITKKAVNQASFTTTALKEIPIPIPPLSVQQSIVAELDTLHRLKELQEQQLTEFDNLAQSTFYSLFGDPIDNEKGWEVRKLGEVVNLKAGQFVKAEDILPFEKSLFPCFGGNGLRGYTKSYTHRGNYVLIGRQGALCGNVKIAKGKFHATEHAVVCNPISDFDTIWLYFVLDELNLNRFATGAAQPGLAVGNLEKIDLIIPPLSLQTAFAERIEKIESQKELVKRSIGETQTLIDYTMDKYFG